MSRRKRPTEFEPDNKAITLATHHIPAYIIPMPLILWKIENLGGIGLMWWLRWAIAVKRNNDNNQKVTSSNSLTKVPAIAIKWFPSPLVVHESASRFHKNDWRHSYSWIRPSQNNTMINAFWLVLYVMGPHVFACVVAKSNRMQHWVADGCWPLGRIINLSTENAGSQQYRWSKAGNGFGCYH